MGVHLAEYFRYVIETAWDWGATIGLGITETEEPGYQIQYLSPSSWGEILDVSTSQVELKPAGGVWFMEINRTTDRERIAQCILEWWLTNRFSREEKLLPENLFRALVQRVANPGNDDI